MWSAGSGVRLENLMFLIMGKVIGYISVFLFSFMAFYAEVAAGEIAPPMKIPFVITANFGELRTNHFHTGIDMRAPVNTPVYAVDSGYVSRISVSFGGYGNALYINHPASGITTVYAHLNSFSPEMEKKLLDAQQKLGFYAVDLYFSPDDIPVKRGQLVALSGNRGSSGGPHLHFEVRETVSERPLDPLKYYANLLKDKRAPVIQCIALMQYPGVPGESVMTHYRPVVSGSGIKRLKEPVKAWGKIILGVKAYDYVTGMPNIYGVRSVKLFKDGELIYSSQIDTLDFSLGRMINTYVDYRDWMENRSFIMRSYVSPGNRLPFYKDVVDNGVVDINEERDYEFRYELSDLYGNTETCLFTIRGDKKSRAEEPRRGSMVGYDAPFEIRGEDFIFKVPENATYEDWAPSYAERDCARKGSYSSLHEVSPQHVPLDKACSVSIRVNNDTVAEKSQYYIAYVATRRGMTGYYHLNTSYSDGWVSAKPSNLGGYVVLRDSLPPVITPLAVSGGELRFKVVDKESGVKFFKGEIDGKPVIFKSDCKDNIARYSIDRSVFPRGKRHHVKFTAIDNCQNESCYESYLLF